MQNRLIAIQTNLRIRSESLKTKRGISSLGAPLLAAIAFVIGVLAVVYIVPLAITEASNTTAITGFSSWPTAIQSIWGLIPYIVAFGAVAILIWVAFEHARGQT